MTNRFATVAICLLPVFGAWLSFGGGQTHAAAAPVPIDVTFKLTDLDYKPIPNAKVRLLFADEPWRAAPTAGQSFVTDATGQARFTTTATVDKKLRKLPTNYLDSLLSRRKETDHLVVGAELDYLSFRWLYVVEMFRFPQGGDVMSDGISAVYNRDGQGRFSRKAVYDGRAWKMPDLNGMMLTTAGHDVFDFALQPKDGVPNAWTLSLAFKRSPEPVRR